MTNDELRDLIDDFIDNQDDSDSSFDEWYDCPKGFSVGVLSNFVDYLIAKGKRITPLVKK